jgi:hypothetical protein
LRFGISICAWLSGPPSWWDTKPSARRELKFLRTRLGRIIRDIRREIEHDPAREECFGPLLDLALRVRLQEQRQRGPKVYSLHAPEVECIGKGKARAPYGSTARSRLDRDPGHHAPRAGSSCCTPMRCTATRMTVTRSIPSSPISKSSQVLRCRRIHREIRCRAAVEPVIGHRMRRNYLKRATVCRARRRRLQLQPATAMVPRTFACPIADPCSSRLRAPASPKSRSENILYRRLRKLNRERRAGRARQQSIAE